jgi:hypothetical protein
MKTALVCVVAMLISSVAFAQGAPYYWFTSKLDGRKVCAQVMNGEGWTKGTTAYKDQNCTIPK